jgi:uridine kinase
MAATTQEILQYLITHCSATRPYLLGIDGGAGSGKSTFTHWLEQGLRAVDVPVSVVHLDNFYFPAAQRTHTQFPLAVVADVDWTRLRDQVLRPLRLGSRARYQMYDWHSDSLKEWVTLYTGGVTIIDGITATRGALAQYYDLRIWFECPREVRAARQLKRGDTAQEEIDHWALSEEEFIAQDNPAQRAHVVIDTELDDYYHIEKWTPPGAKEPRSG